MSEQLLTWDHPESKDQNIPYGTQLRMGYMWGYSKYGPGPHKDIRYTVTNESGRTLEGCIDEMYKLYEAHCAKYQCEPRHHYLEGLKFDEHGDVDIMTGT